MVIDLGPDKIKLKLKNRYKKINIPILEQGFLAISASIFPIMLRQTPTYIASVVRHMI